MIAARQLPLSLPHSAAMTRDDFMVGASNETAAALIDRFPDWLHPIALLVGPPGSGKTHLATIWSMAAGGSVISATALQRDDVEALIDAGPVAVEDIDAAPVDEAALFHLLNRIRERNGFGLLTSRQPLAALPFKLADLNSRLRAAAPATLAEPDDALLSRVIVKLFADRQLMVDAPTVEFILRRIERSLEAANRLVGDLDRLALATRRPITRQLAAELLSGPDDHVARAS